MGKEEVKTCPFCGGKKVEICKTNDRAYWVSCLKCPAEGIPASTRRAAIQRWNKRAKTEGIAKIVMEDV